MFHLQLEAVLRVIEKYHSGCKGLQFFVTRQLGSSDVICSTRTTKRPTWHALNHPPCGSWNPQPNKVTEVWVVSKKFLDFNCKVRQQQIYLHMYSLMHWGAQRHNDQNAGRACLNKTIIFYEFLSVKERQTKHNTVNKLNYISCASNNTDTRVGEEKSSNFKMPVIFLAQIQVNKLSELLS